MTTDHLILGGAALAFLAALVYAFRARKATPKTLFPSLPSVSQSVGSPASESDAAELLVKFYDLVEAEGKKTSAKRHVKKLAGAAADEHDARFAAKLGPKASAPPAAS